MKLFMNNTQTNELVLLDMSDAVRQQNSIHADHINYSLNGEYLTPTLFNIKPMVIILDAEDKLDAKTTDKSNKVANIIRNFISLGHHIILSDGINTVKLEAPIYPVVQFQRTKQALYVGTKYKRISCPYYNHIFKEIVQEHVDVDSAQAYVNAQAGNIPRDSIYTSLQNGLLELMELQEVTKQINTVKYMAHILTPIKNKIMKEYPAMDLLPNQGVYNSKEKDIHFHMQRSETGNWYVSDTTQRNVTQDHVKFNYVDTPMAQLLTEITNAYEYKWLADMNPPTEDDMREELSTLEAEFYELKATAQSKEDVTHFTEKFERMFELRYLLNTVIRGDVITGKIDTPSNIDITWEYFNNHRVPEYVRVTRGLHKGLVGYVILRTPTMVTVNLFNETEEITTKLFHTQLETIKGGK